MPGAIEKLLDMLKWCGITPDEGQLFVLSCIVMCIKFCMEYVQHGKIRPMTGYEQVTPVLHLNLYTFFAMLNIMGPRSVKYLALMVHNCRGCTVSLSYLVFPLTQPSRCCIIIRHRCNEYPNSV